MDPQDFFDGWSGLLRVVVVGSLAYAALVLILRVTGKRTLSKMNAFDLIVTVALGSTLATVLLSRDVALAEGVTALLLLCLLQYAVTFLSVRSSAFQDFVKARPTLIFHRGRYLEDAMRKERVTREEILAALRSQGRTDAGSVDAVVLETDGSLTVMGSAGKGSQPLAPVEGWTEARR